MNPVLAAALIQGGTSLLGGLFGSKSAKNASKVEAETARQALAFAREQEAARQKEHAEQVALMRAQYEAEQARLAPFRAAKQRLLSQQAKRLNLGSLAGYGQARPPVPAANTLAGMAGGM